MELNMHNAIADNLAIKIAKHNFYFANGKLPWAGNPLKLSGQGDTIGGRFKEFSLI